MLGYVIHHFEIISQTVTRNSFNGNASYIFHGFEVVQKMRKGTMNFF